MKTTLLTFLMTMAAVIGYAQSELKGRVTDEGGQALPGVNVLVKGTSTGTVTDANGTYVLQGVPADATIVFSFIGYASQEIPLAGKSTLDATLLPDVKSLQEVVVVGYGTSTVKELTGSVSSVSGKDLTAMNPTQMEQSLQGKAAGVQISSTSGSPGGPFAIRIRGVSTNGDSAPLILVDGVPYSPEGLSALNPSDIESINILKDATAGIYGVRSANGVIIVTTKKGRQNTAPSFEFSGYVGMQETSKKLNLLNAHEFAVLKNEAYASGALPAPYNNTNLGKGTDWQNEVFQRAPIQNYNLTVTGGSDKSTYSIGGSYLNQEGIVGGSKASYQRYNARVNFTTELAPKVTLQNILLYTNERRRTLPENGIGSVLYNTINASPLDAPRNPDGTFTYLQEVNEVINPLAMMANTFNQTNTNKLVGKEELSYKMNSHFEFTGRAGYNYAIVDGRTFNPLVYYGQGKPQNTAANAALDPVMVNILNVPTPRTASVNQSRTTYFNYNLEAFLNFNHTIGEDHKIKGTLGASMFGDRSSDRNFTVFNIPYNSYDYADVATGDKTSLLNTVGYNPDLNVRSRLESYFVRGEYAYKSKYLLSAIIRRDASSKFGPNNRVGYFPSVSAAWVASDESFFRSSLIQFLKVRASYGVVGNDRIKPFLYRGNLGGEAVYPFNDVLVTGVAVGTVSNPDLKWESTHQSDIGFDLNMLGDKVSITADYYVKTTKDLLFTPDVSGILGSYGAGGSPPTINGGNVRNQGFEFTINYNTTFGQDLHFNVGYNVTTINNKVTYVPGAYIPGGYFSVGGGVASRMQVGYPIGAFFGYKTDGVYQTAAEVSDRNVSQPDAQPGDLRYVDVNKDGTISFSDNSDITQIGSPIPKAIMGLNFGLTFKGIDFAATFYTSLGNDILRNYERQQPLANLLNYKINRWTGPGSTNTDPRLTTAANNNVVFSNYFVEDGSFLRCKNVQLGYSLPTSLINKIGAKKLRLYVAVNNLFTLTKYKGYDPDFTSSNPLTAGIDYGFYPQARTYQAGLNLNF